MFFPLHPIPASILLTVEFALEVRSNPQFCSIPEAIHLTGEVLGEWGEWITSRVSSLVCAAVRRPVVALRDHRFVVDYGELVMELVASSKARGSDALLLQQC